MIAVVGDNNSVTGHTRLGGIPDEDTGGDHNEQPARHVPILNGRMGQSHHRNLDFRPGKSTANDGLLVTGQPVVCPAFIGGLAFDSLRKQIPVVRVSASRALPHAAECDSEAGSTIDGTSAPTELQSSKSLLEKR